MANYIHFAIRARGSITEIRKYISMAVLVNITPYGCLRPCMSMELMRRDV
jgi:hypothetical protein